MLYTLRILLDTLFPPTAHGIRLRTITPEIFVRYYSECTVDTVTALSTYHIPAVQAAVAACKFEQSLHAPMLLASLMNEWLSRHPTTGRTVIIPIPLSRARQSERGFNQVERVLTYLPKTPIRGIETRWLKRPLNTARQTSLDRVERQKNMTHAFAVTGQVARIDWSAITRVIITDDVLTTGATLNAARATLAPHLPAHVELICLAWAH